MRERPRLDAETRNTWQNKRQIGLNLEDLNKNYPRGAIHSKPMTQSSKIG